MADGRPGAGRWYRDSGARREDGVAGGASQRGVPQPGEGPFRLLGAAGRGRGLAEDRRRGLVEAGEEGGGLLPGGGTGGRRVDRGAVGPAGQQAATRLDGGAGQRAQHDARQAGRGGGGEAGVQGGAGVRGVGLHHEVAVAHHRAVRPVGQYADGAGAGVGRGDGVGSAGGVVGQGGVQVLAWHGVSLPGSRAACPPGEAGAGQDAPGRGPGTRRRPRG